MVVYRIKDKEIWNTLSAVQIFDQHGKEMLKIGRLDEAAREFELVLAADERIVGWKGREINKDWLGAIGEP